MNSRINLESFWPGDDSKALDASTPNGLTVRIAAATLSGPRPPARTI
jgi:hypothetical protein